MEFEPKTKERQTKIDLENAIVESLKTYKLSGVIVLDRKKLEITLKNTFLRKPTF